MGKELWYKGVDKEPEITEDDYYRVLRMKKENISVGLTLKDKRM